MCWVSVPWKTVNLLGKPTHTVSDASAILDLRPPNKHFSSSLLPFELGVGSPPNRWWQSQNLGLGYSVCLCFCFQVQQRKTIAHVFSHILIHEKISRASWIPDKFLKLMRVTDLLEIRASEPRNSYWVDILLYLGGSTFSIVWGKVFTKGEREISITVLNTILPHPVSLSKFLHLLECLFAQPFMEVKIPWWWLEQQVPTQTSLVSTFISILIKKNNQWNFINFSTDLSSMQSKNSQPGQ